MNYGQAIHAVKIVEDVIIEVSNEWELDDITWFPIKVKPDEIEKLYITLVKKEE